MSEQSPKEQTVESLAAAMVAALPITVEDFIREQTAAWDALVRAVEDDMQERTITEADRAKALVDLTESLSPAQWVPYQVLEGAETESSILERQAAFELGRQYERARLGGTR